MSDQRWHRVDRLFQAALDRPVAHRIPFLEDACEGDAELLAEVRALLAATEAEGQGLEPGGGAALVGEVLGGGAPEDASLEADAPGERWRLLERIGRGGMGTVYLAERADGRYEGRAAVKVLRRGVDTADVLRRFLAERRILADLDHPGIARLIDAGETADGRPYIVMEHVEGQPIDRWCEEEGLGAEARIGLVARVAEAVGHAHRRLVVHRDLKPSNILVTGDGRVKLLDFGIAKLLDDREGAARPTTGTGPRPLTPGYASPEQLAGEPVGTASDVYQLGVILRVLLTGRPPEAATRRAARGDRLATPVPEALPEPPSAEAPPRLLAPRRMRADLDAVVLQALRPDPEERYRSVEALAEDLDRCLRGRPVRARPAGPVYRLRKLVRRKPGAAAAAALIVAVVAGWIWTLTAYAHRLEEEREAARLEARKAERVTSFVTGLFAHADPDRTRGDVVTARELLDSGTVRLRRELADQPALRATLLSTAAGVYQSLGQSSTARELASEVLELRRGLLTADHPELLESTILLGRTVYRTDPDSARALFREAVAMAERAFGPDDPRVAGPLELLGAYGGLGAEARTAAFERALALRRAAGDTTSEAFADALMLSAQGGPLPLEEKVARLERARTIFARLFGPEDARVGEVLSDMALGLEQADPVAADSLLRRAIEIHRAAMGPTHPTTLTLMNNYAGVLRDRGEWARAERAYREVLAARSRAHPEDRVGLAYIQYGLGYVLNRTGGLAEAETLLGRAALAFQPGDARRALIEGELEDNASMQEERGMR